MNTPGAPTWAEVVSPIVSKLATAHMVAEPVSLNPEGSKAIAELLYHMARHLDSAGVSVNLPG